MKKLLMLLMVIASSCSEKKSDSCNIIPMMPDASINVVSDSKNSDLHQEYTFAGKEDEILYWIYRVRHAEDLKGKLDFTTYESFEKDMIILLSTGESKQIHDFMTSYKLDSKVIEFKTIIVVKRVDHETLHCSIVYDFINN